MGICFNIFLTYVLCVIAEIIINKFELWHFRISEKEQQWDLNYSKIKYYINKSWDQISKKILRKMSFSKVVKVLWKYWYKKSNGQFYKTYIF